LKVLRDPAFDHFFARVERHYFQRKFGQKQRAVAGFQDRIGREQRPGRGRGIVSRTLCAAARAKEQKRGERKGE